MGRIGEFSSGQHRPVIHVNVHNNTIISRFSLELDQSDGLNLMNNLVSEWNCTVLLNLAPVLWEQNCHERRKSGQSKVGSRMARTSIIRFFRFVRHVYSRCVIHIQAVLPPLQLLDVPYNDVPLKQRVCITRSDFNRTMYNGVKLE